MIMNETRLQVERQPWYLAELIKQGQTVEIDGHYYSIFKIKENVPAKACDCCNVGSNCKGNVLETCRLLECDEKYRYGLWLFV